MLVLKTLIIIIFSLTLHDFAPKKADVKRRPVATCYGRSPCATCSNCSQCKHCNAGGSCGVCSGTTTRTTNSLSSDRSKTITRKSSDYRGQCKALTKKGSRCKRNGDTSGYCWQHGK